jgi:ferritin
MISPDVQKALNGQLNFELFSAYSYAGIAAYFEELNLEGFSQWLGLQVQEELEHAAKFYAYIHDVGGRVELDAIDKPQGHFDSPLHAFETVYHHECAVTKQIHKLMDVALNESDHSTSTFLQWFVTEQVEEEKTADHIVQQLRRIGGDANGLFMLDREMTKRTPDQDADGGSN